MVKLAPFRFMFLILIAAVIVGCASQSNESDGDSNEPFWPSSTCQGCHSNIAAQHGDSLHAYSYINPLFQAQFFGEYLPRFHDDLAGFRKEPPCLACHAPMAFLESNYDIAKQLSMEREDKNPCDACHGAAGHVNQKLIEAHDEVDLGESEDSQRHWKLTFVDGRTRELARSGVGCDFCHTVTSTRGDGIGNANYVSRPGPIKLGPFKYQSGAWHHAYSELQTKSEFCGMCHNAHNRYGDEIRSTFTEWKASKYAAEGIQCQDCHMTQAGMLQDGKAIYESGRAAQMTLGSAPERDKLYTHKFIGAHSSEQVAGALHLEVVVVEEPAPGQQLMVEVTVHNSNAGHSLPTGSPELRLVWLEVEASEGGRMLPSKCEGEDGCYGVAGENEFDEQALGEVVPAGSRLYRAVFLDPEGWETLNFYDAAERIFDNRLLADEHRTERFHVEVPKNAEGEVTVDVRVWYLRYPPGFAEAMGQEPIDPVLMASSSVTVAMGGLPASPSGI